MKILVIDSAEVIWYGLKGILGEIGHNLTPAASVARAREILAGRLDFDMVIMDPAGQNGDALRLLSDFGKELKFVIFTNLPEDLYCENHLRAGAKGFLSKDTSARLLMRNIETVAEGGIAVGRAMNAKLVARAAGRSVEDSSGDPVRKLSDRELEVYSRLGQGETTRQIAESLKLSPKTIETYRENIKEKLKLESGTALMRSAVAYSIHQDEKAKV